MDEHIEKAFTEFDMIPLMYPGVMVNDWFAFSDAVFVTGDSEKMLVAISYRDEDGNVYITSYYIGANDNELMLYRREETLTGEEGE